MTKKHWWWLAGALVVFYLLAFEVPGWIAHVTGTGLTPWRDF